ncbi:MAG: signal recognition particle-docking protein FtsY [Deltaproteobacteria bacterium]|nr:signal recognition particle-docking protein FtsY [Deltaproteobacteria bacterium]
MDEVSLLIEQALVWLTQNASIAVAAGSSLLALFLLFIDSRLSKASDEASVSSPEPAASIEPVPAQEIVAEPEPEPESEVAAAAEPSAAEVQELQPEPEPEPPPEPEPEPEPPPEPVRVGLRDRLSKTSQNLVGRLGRVLGAKAVDEALLEELEGVLLTADLGVATAESLLESVKSRAMGGDASRVREVLREAIMEKLAKAEAPSQIPLAQPGPHVILVLGVNGSGKTTTIGKLAAQYTRTGKQVVLGAGDTFRAAAAEQLQIWGERSGAEVVVGKAGGDPAAVAFDAVKTAITGGADVCIIDTAGRLQTKKPLMEELAKINRVLSRDIAQAPHECLLVLDSNTGQNAISQARLFTEVAEITGLVLTKLDGTAKGGVIVGLADEFEIPVKYVGVGEGIDDLQEFHAEEFVNALFEEG